MQIKNKLMEPVSIAGLVWFRILFGGIMLYEVYRYYSYDWIYARFAENEFHFKFFGFDWLPDISQRYFYNLWGLMGVLSLFVMVGFFYRVSIILFTLVFSYIFLIEQANYLNHFYFVCLMSFVMCLIDPHRALSMDAASSRIERSNVVPYWQHLLLCFQMGVVYFFGGIAKIDPDWLTGVPLNLWLDRHESLPIIGEILRSDLTALGFSLFGFLLDLLIVPALMFRRTRLFGFACILSFHIMNHFLFDIGIFPWFSIATTLLFFGPDFPQKFLRKIGLESLNPLGPLKEGFIKRPSFLTQAVLILFCLYNVLMPLRHHFYPGDVHWNERGHLFSWRMKLRNKEGPVPVFYIQDLVTGKEWKEEATDRLSMNQADTMRDRPEMILQYVKYLKKRLILEGHLQVKIRVLSNVSLNGRPLEPLMDENLDLAQAEDCVFCEPRWIRRPKNERSWSDSFQRLKDRLAQGE